MVDVEKRFEVYKYGTDKAKWLSSYKEVNFELTPIAKKNDCVEYKTYTGTLVDVTEQTATLRYFIEDSKIICGNTETNSLMEVTVPGYYETVELPMRQVNSIWYEPQAKNGFLTAAKVFAFTGLILAPIASLDLKAITSGTDPTVTPHFNSKLYGQTVIGSALGAGLSLGLYFTFNERNLSFFKNAKPNN